MPETTQGTPNPSPTRLPNPIRTQRALIRAMNESPTTRLIQDSGKADADGIPLYAVYDIPEDDPAGVLVAYIENHSEAALAVFLTIRDGTDLTPDRAQELPLRYLPMAGACILSSAAGRLAGV